MCRRKTSLNGEWGFIPFYDGYEPGEVITGLFQKSERIYVPSSWRTRLLKGSLSGEDVNFYNVFEYPEEWNEVQTGIIHRKSSVEFDGHERVWLVFNGILQRSKIYLNNRLILQSEEAFLPLQIDITDFLNSCAETIDIKVWCGTFRTVETENGKRHVAPDGTWFAGMSRGIWQDVYLQYTPDLYIEDYRVVTSYREGKIDISAQIACKSLIVPTACIKAFIHDDERLIKELTSDDIQLLPESIINIDIYDEWKTPVIWSPENPKLYSLELKLVSEGILMDTVVTRFGFREIWADGHKLYLNGTRINLRGDSWHYQGFAQQTKEFALNWYKMCRDIGINFIRLHGMPYPEFYIEAADEVGMLIIDESAVYGSAKSIRADHPDFIENCRKHLEMLVKRDRNHPSVIMWSMQNEMRWVDGRDGYKSYIKKLMYVIKKLDNTRLISCDGDNRLLSSEDMQVMSMHYNLDGTVNDWDKSLPLVFGEHGKWHYISPQVTAELGGQGAYLSFDEALKSLGMQERLFLEYARKHEVTGISPFNICYYNMKSMPEKDIRMEWDNTTAIGIKPRLIVNNSLTINNGLIKNEKAYKPNSSFDMVKDGFKQVVIFADEYNNSFYGDADILRNFSIYNDTMDEKLAKIISTIYDEKGVIVQAEELCFMHQPGERFCYSIRFKTPDVNKMETMTLKIELYHEGLIMYTLIKEYIIYPKLLKKKKLRLDNKKLAYIGSIESAAVLSYIVEDFKVLDEITEESLKDKDILVIGKDIGLCPKIVQPVLDNFTRSGGVLIILEQKSFSVGDITLSGRRYFKSFINSIDHKIFTGLTDKDLEFWDAPGIFESNCRYMVSNAFNKPVKGDMKILLECGEGDFGWGGLLWAAMLEYVNGKGLVILNQLDIIDNFFTVPQASVILINILEYAALHTSECKKSSTMVLSRDGSRFKQFFQSIGIKRDLDWDGTCISGKMLAVLEPDLLGSMNIEGLKKILGAGGTIVMVDVSPCFSKVLSTLSGQEVIIERAPVYQVAGTGSELVNGISAFDLYKFEKATYSPPTRENTILCDYMIEAADTEVLLENVKNPWEEFFVNGLDSEAIKNSIAIKIENSVFIKRNYGILLKCGIGRIIISQVKLLDNDKISRFYTRLLSNLGIEIETDILKYIKEDTDFAIDSFMGLLYDKKMDFNKMEMYFSERNYRLNNLGEGVYGWMVRFEKKDGYIHIPMSANKTYFITVFIESDMNRNPFKREDGELPDNSIVPNLSLKCNCSFKLWVDGICYMEKTNTTGEFISITVEDILLEKGLNNMLIICSSSVDDIKLNVCFINKYGSFLVGLKYQLTVD